MKLAITLPIFLSSPFSINGASIRGLRTTKDTDAPTAVVDIEGECSSKTILPLIQGNPYFSEALKGLDSVDKVIDELCNNHNHRSLQEDTAGEIPFSHVTAQGRQFDKNYFDGGTDWNLGVGGIDRKTSAARIPSVAGALSSQKLQWPSHIVNFDDSESCQLRTAMCCFTKAQDASTGVVSNINDFPGTLDFNANADVCLVHLDRSPQAGHTKKGKTYYSDGRKVVDETKDAYCTGFSWTESEDDLSTKYRANTLFHISMHNSFYKNNLVGGVPGAPMCGCVEQMPVVSHATCVKPVQARRLSVSKENRLLLNTSLNFVPCNDGVGEDSLVAAYAQDASNDADALSKIITGSCVEAVDTELASNNYKRGDTWWYADEEKWTPVVGTKLLYYPQMSQEDFKKAFEASSTKTIRRICKSCSPSHRDVYYKRLTPVPDSLNLLTMLNSSFSSENNVLGVDFEMYSKDKNGLITNWQHCTYSTTKGFPAQCGPDGPVGQQMTVTPKPRGTYATTYAFYIEK